MTVTLTCAVLGIVVFARAVSPTKQLAERLANARFSMAGE
jgi:hypothetical protein